MKDCNNHIFNRQVSTCHIFYWILITIIINIFLLVICPGHVSKGAMDNISFASAIVSIVLALISIVYSLQSGYSSSSQLDGIKTIEGNIQAELEGFENLRNTISQAIDPLNKTVGAIQKTAGDIQKAQDNIQRNIEDLNKPITLELSDSSNGDKKKDVTLTHTMVVALYAAVLSKETGMDIPFHIFANFIGMKSHYVEGMLEGLSSFDYGLKLEVGSSSTRKKVSAFDGNTFGSKEELRAKALSNSNRHFGEDFISKIDLYFSDRKNQQPKDSVG